MDFRLLGPLEVESGGTVVRIAGAKERAVLALLLFHANRVVSRDRLVDELWGDRPPATARHTLEAYVSRLRRALSATEADSLIESQPGGYRVRVADDELDVLQFERQLNEGRSALARGAPAEAERKLTAALDLWRGEVVGDTAFEPFAAGEVKRLEELRLAAVEGRAEAVLGLGRYAELVGELGALVAEHPFREGLRSQLMLALYRSGRQADALATYLDGRRRLIDELGIEPSRELEELQQAILRHDPALDAPAVTTAETTAVVATPAEAAGLEVHERRKVVTVLACEPSEWPGPADDRDPEVVDGLLRRFFERMSGIIGRHGGTIEKSMGDALIAVFGVPLLHEDDALRALRAATEMSGALRELGVGCGIGVTTGEVLTGTDERLATGAAFRLATGLAHAAGPNEILLGQETVRLLGSLVEVEPVAPWALRGRSGSRAAFRFRAMAAPVEREPTPLIDRQRELTLLAESFRRAVDERELHLFTLLGPAGIGKSRLAREFLGSVGSGVRVARGRCLSYGQSITYWPLVEVLRAIGKPARLALKRVVSGGAVSPQELAWTVQRAFEQAAVDRPLVILFEDLHWAEPALLDLIDLVCERSRGFPILLLCAARTELLEQRPGWSGGRLNATTVLLETLGRSDAEKLVGALQRPLGPGERERVVQVAAGNPLFLEELTEFVAEGGGGGLPPRIHVLLQARLDRLSELERRVLCCAAVEGTVFHAGGLEALLHEMGGELGTPLAGLSRKLLIRQVPGELEGEDAFRFRHQLIRDTAYAAIPKADRARLHERFAGWLDRHTGNRGELAEIAAYHLEQAALVKRELGASDTALDLRAADRLAAAAARANMRSDLPAAASLWRRSLALLDPDDPQVPGLELELALTLTWSGGLDEARRILEHAEQRTVDPAVATSVRLARLQVQSFLAPEGVPAAIRRECAAGIPLLEQSGDDRALARAWSVLGWAEWIEQQVEATSDAWKRCATHAHLAGDRALEAQRLGLRAYLATTTSPYAFVIRELEGLAARFPGEPAIQAPLALWRAVAAYQDGRAEEARAIAEEGVKVARRTGHTLYAATAGAIFGRVALAAGQIDEAETLALDAVNELQDLGERGLLSYATVVLAETRIAQGRLHDALQLANRAEEAAGPQDRQIRIDANSARGRAYAQLGRIEEAKTAAAVAVAVAGSTDSTEEQAHAQWALAEVMAAAADLPAALVAAEEASRLYTVLDRPLERRQVAVLTSQIKRGLGRRTRGGTSRG